MTTMRELRRWYLANAAVPVGLAAVGTAVAVFAPFTMGERAGFLAIFALILAVHFTALTYEYGWRKATIRAGLRRVKVAAMLLRDSSGKVLTDAADGCSIYNNEREGGERE
jgi:hypothetical protein